MEAIGKDVDVIAGDAGSGKFQRHGVSATNHHVKLSPVAHAIAVRADDGTCAVNITADSPAISSHGGSRRFNVGYGCPGSRCQAEPTALHAGIRRLMDQRDGVDRGIGIDIHGSAARDKAQSANRHIVRFKDAEHGVLARAEAGVPVEGRQVQAR